MVQRKQRSNPDQPLTLFLGYTSNLISSGLREIIRFLAQHKLVDCLVTTAGGVEEDFIKCLGSTVLGDFHLPGAELRKKGLNRIGNLLVPNSNYCKFEDWVVPILDQLVKEQEEDGARWSPSTVINRLGKEIDNEESVYYWCWKVSLDHYYLFLPIPYPDVHACHLVGALYSAVPSMYRGPRGDQGLTRGRQH